MMESCLMMVGAGRVPLTGVEITGEIAAGTASIAVHQRYRNLESRPVEAVYTFPLPADAVLAGFSMICQGRRVDAVVQESEAAFRAYDDAINAGHGAALLEQHRPDVFSVNVGNLLPGEDVELLIRYVQRLKLDDGAVRAVVPTLVAPRYIPGGPAGDRTGHGVVSPTDQVPDADRITPPIGPTPYGLTVDLVVDLGADVAVESPSHVLTVTPEEGGRRRVRLCTPGVALDRDLVILATPTLRESEAACASALMHASAQGGQPVVAVQVIPDLGLVSRRSPREVVFLIDVSGSMEGRSLPAAQTALRLCLRQLRAGDRFNIFAFESRFQVFSSKLRTFDQAALDAADAWVNALKARGGTEILLPLKAAVQQAPDGLILLLTDGQVGNEDAVVAAVAEHRKTARVYGFGIGTNVGQGLLDKLARLTGGETVGIFPGERIDDKVVSQLASGLAPRVSDLRVRAQGFDISEPAPPEAPALVDGHLWSWFFRLDRLARGVVVLEGTLEGRPFRLEVPVEPAEARDRPGLARLWASERIRALELLDVSGRRGASNRDRIIELAKAHGLSSRHTSFVVVEERTGERRSSGMPETRVVPVSAPLGWAMRQQQPALARGGAPGALAGRARQDDPGMLAMVPGGPADAAPDTSATAFFAIPAPKKTAEAPRARADSSRAPSSPPRPAPAAPPAPSAPPSFPSAGAPPPPATHAGVDGAIDVLGIQRADGLWWDHGRSGDLGHRAAQSVSALLKLWDLGVDATHAVYGAQVKKAVDALSSLISPLLDYDPELGWRVLATLWLVGGRRVRLSMAAKAASHPGFAGRALADERAVRGSLRGF